MRMKKAIYLALGWVGLILGGIGAAVPFLPTFPFLIMAAFGFGKSSERLERWFKGTKLYQKNLASYVEGRGMTKGAKARVMTTVTIFMGIGFLMMGSVPVGRVVLACVWVFHLIYFIFGVKTLEEGEKEGKEKKSPSTSSLDKGSGSW